MKMVEHVFVADRAWPELRDLLTKLLQRYGFGLASTCLGCGGGGDPPSLGALDPLCPRCGLPRKFTFRSPADPARRRGGPFSRPIWLTLDYNRGRVELAATIETRSKPDHADELVLHQLARSIERVVAGAEDVQAVYREWVQLKHRN